MPLTLTPEGRYPLAHERPAPPELSVNNYAAVYEASLSTQGACQSSARFVKACRLQT